VGKQNDRPVPEQFWKLIPRSSAAEAGIPLKKEELK